MNYKKYEDVFEHIKCNSGDRIVCRTAIENLITHANLILLNIDKPELASLHLTKLSEQYNELEHLLKLRRSYSDGILPLNFDLA